MPHTITKTVYHFGELSDKAKEKAREWYREGALDYDWYDAIYEHTDTIASILGIEIGNITQNWINSTTGKSGTHTKLRIWFSGFYSQGDGACFEGEYTYKRNAHKAIRSYAPSDETLHSIADDLLALQRKHGYRLEARVKHSGHYYHSNCTDIDVTDKRTGDNVGHELEKEMSVELRRFMDWIYRSLESESDWLQSDEQVDDSILTNEYKFDEDGRRST